MRDYFGGIIKKIGETGATRRNKPIDASVSKALMASDSVASCNKLSGDRGDITAVSPPVAPSNFKGETPEAPERLVSPPSPLVSPEEIRFAYDERAAIFQHDGNLPRTEAEDRAYQLALREFVSQGYPTVLSEFESIIYNSTTIN